MKHTHRKLSKTVLITLLLILSALHLGQITYSQPSGTVVNVQPPTTNVRSGETFTVNVTIESVQNLYGIDVTLRWNNSLLQFQSVDLRLGVESHTGGILHEDSNTEIYIATNEASEAEYQLAATSVFPASSFNGSGTIFQVGFKAIATGRSSFGLETELADRPLPGEIANLIEHTTVPGQVESSENGFIEPTSLNGLILIIVVIAIIFIAITVIFYIRKRQAKKQSPSERTL